MLRLGKRLEAEEPLKRVLAFAEETGNLVMETLAVGNLALVYKYLPGRQNDTVRMTRKHLALARRTGSRVLELQAVGNLGTVLEREASSPEVFVLLENAVELAGKYGGNEALSISQANLGRAYQRVGKYQEALKSLRTALQICKEEGMRIHQTDYAYEIAHILMDLGLLNQAQDLIRQIDEWQVPDDYRYNILWCKSKLLRLQGHTEEAALALREGLRQFTDNWDKFDLLHELYLSTGDREVLKKCLEQGEILYTEAPHWDFRIKLDELASILKSL